MNTRQENRLSMFMVVRDYLIKNAASTAVLPNFTDFFSALVDGITQIHNIREQQEVNKKGFVVTKRSLKTRLLTLALDISGKMLAYAGFTQNDVLFNEVNYTKSDLVRCADTVLFDRVRIISERAQANAADLIPYAVTAPQLADLQIILDSYNAYIPKPRLGITAKKQATDRLSVLIKQVTQTLQQIDCLIKVIRNSAPEFYSTYQSVRKIVDNGQGKMALMGKVNDLEFGNALHGAMLIFKRVGDNGNLDADFKEIIKKSAKKGGFSVKKLPQGTYKVHITKPGFVDGTFTVYVTHGEPCRFEAGLQALKM